MKNNQEQNENRIRLTNVTIVIEDWDDNTSSAITIAVYLPNKQKLWLAMEELNFISVQEDWTLDEVKERKCNSIRQAKQVLSLLNTEQKKT